jgi:hypothetical protein
MIAIVLTVLFIASGMLAAAIIAIGLRAFPAAFTNLRSQVREFDGTREVSFRKTDVMVSASARILRPHFTGARGLLQADHDLHAAA